jgi:hypothetical protein
LVAPSVRPLVPLTVASLFHPPGRGSRRGPGDE